MTEPELDFYEDPDVLDVNSSRGQWHEQITEPETKQDRLIAASRMGLGGLPGPYDRPPVSEMVSGFIKATLSMPPRGSNLLDDEELASDMDWRPQQPQQQQQQQSSDSRGGETKSASQPTIMSQSNGKEEKMDGPPPQSLDFEAELEKRERFIVGSRLDAANLATEAMAAYQQEELVYSKSKREQAKALASARPTLILPKPRQVKSSSSAGGSTSSQQVAMDDGDDTKKAPVRKPPKGTYIDSLQDRYLSMLGRANQATAEAMREAAAKRLMLEAHQMAERVNDGNEQGTWNAVDDTMWSAPIPIKVSGQKTARTE